MRLLLAMAATLVLSASAAADIGIVAVTPSVVRPGQVLRVHVNGYLPMHAPSMPIVLVRTDLMPHPYPCEGGTAICDPIMWRARLARPPYRLVGFARRWIRSRRQPDHADALLRLRVPRLPAARYTVALWCGPCVRGPQGSLIAGPTVAFR